MKTFASRKIQYALGALALAALAAAVLFSPARAMVERAATGDATRHAAVAPVDSVTQASSGIISVRVLPNLDGPPPPAARFYGTLKSGGAAAGSTTVSALAGNGATCGSATVSAPTYALDITGTDSACTAAGAPMHFLINGKTANASGKALIPSVSAAVHSDLTAP